MLTHTERVLEAQRLKALITEDNITLPSDSSVEKFFVMLDELRTDCEKSTFEMIENGMQGQNAPEC